MAEGWNYDEPIIFGTGGGRAQIYYKLTCSSNVKIGSKPTWVNVINSDVNPYGEGGVEGVFEIEVDAYDAGRSREYIYFMVGEDYTCTDKSIGVEQEGVNCSCNDVTNITFATIPQSGITSTTDVLAPFV